MSHEKNKPIMFSASQIFVCDGKRCNEVQTENVAGKVRSLAQSLGYDKGKNRVKITRTFCNGACRFKSFAYVYQNTKAENFTIEQAYSAWKKVEEWTDDQWKELIISVVKGQNPSALNAYRVEEAVYEENIGHHK